MSKKTKDVHLGLKANWKQFTLLVLVNAFVGGMVGLERAIFPQFADEEFGVASNSAILSFIIAFGISKAISNYYAGKLANRYGRRTLLIYGWLIAMPVPLMLIYADHWYWVVFANVLLGISQGLTWSSTVVMKIDLVGEKDRGFAMGLNEFSGYFAVGLIAFVSGYIANEYGVTPYPFYLGIVLTLMGFLLSVTWVKDTRAFVKHESLTASTFELENVFNDTTFRDKTLSSITQAGMINNMNDGMIWGLLPILLMSSSFEMGSIGIITAIYPMVWGIGQLFTGKMADIYSKRSMLFWGMLLQGIVIVFIPFGSSFLVFSLLATLLGIGTALVYPTFLAAIADATSPNQRAESIGTFRLWRDLGYALGAIFSGILADVFGLTVAIISIGVLTLFSALVIQYRMPKTSN